MNRYLESSRYIDWQHPEVSAKATELADGKTGSEEIVRACFEFVRDEIRHSRDYEMNPVTCVASDVLKHGTGYCYAKSHLLAALLRANGIPTGLCYQRLTIDNDEPPFSLHGLNAVWLENGGLDGFGWYRIDARGNKPGVDAQFHPPVEQLAFPIVTEGEMDLPEIWPEPLKVITDTLENHATWQAVLANLPDIELLPNADNEEK